MSELEQFTEFIFGDAQGYVYSPTKSKDQQWGQSFFHWPSQKLALHDYIRTSSLDRDVYICPSLFSEKSSKKEAIKTTSVAWVEFDGKTTIDFKDVPEPNLIIQSSTDTHLHCYWKIPDAPVEIVEGINRRLTYHLDADSSGWDANQVLRPPETNNWKLETPRPVLVKKFQDKLFDFSSFDSAPTVKNPLVAFTYDSLLEPHQIKLSAELKDRIFKQVPLEPKQRSHFLMSCGHLLAEDGLNPLEITSLLYVVDCRIKKFVGRDDQLVRLSEIAAIAHLKMEADNLIESYSPDDIINHELSLNWLIEGWLHDAGLMLLSGAPGVGKTQFSFDIAYRLATGSALLHKAETNPVSVAYLSLEMDIVELKYIFEFQNNDFDRKELWNRNVKVFSFEDNTFSNFERVIRESRPSVVIIDSLSELCSDDMKETEAKKIMTWFKKMRRTYSCSFIVIHHNRKANDTNKKPVKLSDLYGSFIFAAKSDTVVSLWQEEGKNHLELETLKSRFGKHEKIDIVRSENLGFSLPEVKNVDIKRVYSPPDGNLGLG